MGEANQKFRPILDFAYQSTLQAEDLALNSEVAAVRNLFEDQLEAMRLSFYSSAITGFELFKFHQLAQKVLYKQHCQCSECRFSHQTPTSSLISKCKKQSK